MDHPIGKEIELAYLAGLIDGEGSVSKDGSSISIGMTDKEVIDWVAKFCCAWGYQYSRRTNDNHGTNIKIKNNIPPKLIYYITISGRNAKLLICRLRPYIIIPRKKPWTC